MMAKTHYSAPRRTLLFFWIAILIFAGFFAGVVSGVKLANPQTYVPENGGQYFDAQLYEEVSSVLRETFVDPTRINNKDLFYGALKGMVAAVGDPYTTFFDPQENKEFNDELSGSFGGIGAELGMKNNRLTIIAPLPGSPAERAGLRAGDIIVSIDKTDAAGFSLDEAVAAIRGKRGTSVQLAIYHTESNDLKTVTIRRDTIVVPTVLVKYTSDLAVMSLYNFNAESEKQFIRGITEIKSHGVRGMILDLRNNPGGFLDKSVQVASAWLQKGVPVVREVAKEKTTQTYTAVNQIAAPQGPLVILVNEGTASAAEILAGALQDHGKAILIGAKTYGKGSVQEVKELTDGSAVKITISQWVTPNGRLINEVGITPDIIVPMTDADYAAGNDPQLDRAVQYINDKLNEKK